MRRQTGLTASLESLPPNALRLLVATLVALIFIVDLASPLPWGVLYLIPIVLTFWSSDTWMPRATGAACAVCLGLVLMVEGNVVPPRWLLFNRVAGFGILLAAGWLISEHRRVVTERGLAEKAARHSEERLNEAVEVARLGFFEIDHASPTVRWSASAQRLLNWGIEGPMAWEDCLSKVHPDDRTAVTRAIADTCDPSGDGRCTLEHRVVTDGLEVRYVLTSLATTFSGAEPRTPARTVGTVVDITARKQLEIQRDKLALQLLQVQENERQALARDLHEEVGQALSVLRLNLLRIRRDAAEASEIAYRSIEIVDEAIRGVRDVTLSLRPPVLDDLGLGEAVQWFVDRTRQRTGIHLDCTVEPSLSRFSPATEIACFRVLQEAVSNLCRHAKAERGNVQLRRREEALELVVRDDGIGFDVDAATAAANRGASVGLASMGERTGLLGGSLRIRAVPGQGCEVLARFPVEHAVSDMSGLG